jgi:phage terminase large subunit-like protein
VANRIVDPQEIINFVEILTVPSGVGAGGFFVMRPFQQEFIRDVYGPLDNAGQRIVRRAILSMARKNGKTALIACLALAHLWGPLAEVNGEIYSAATEREQAGIVFKYAAQIVRAEPELEAEIKVVDSTKTMVSLRTGSVYRALSADAGSKYGLNPTVVIYDELAQARNRDLYDALDTSMAAREQPLFIVISTQSNDPQHILSQLIDDGLNSHDKTTVCHLYAVPDDAPADDCFKSKKVWQLANPALGDFRSLPEMKTAAKRAARMPAFETAFRNLYLNQRVDAKSPMIPRAEWEGCQGKVDIQPGAGLYLGLDLSGKIDLSALIGVTDGDKSQVAAWFFKPEDTLKEHEARDRVPYTLWKKQGHIITSPGQAIQYSFVAHEIAKIHKDYNILGIAFDRYRIDDLLVALEAIGVECFIDGKQKGHYGQLRLVPWGQGFASMTQAVEALEVSILERLLVHNGHPCLTWNVSNAIAVADAAGNRKLDKSKTRFRIDGVVALAMAEGLKSRDRKEISVFDTLSLDRIKERMAF